jgi:hypothetical protein
LTQREVEKLIEVARGNAGDATMLLVVFRHGS